MFELASASPASQRARIKEAATEKRDWGCTLPRADSFHCKRGERIYLPLFVLQTLCSSSKTAVSLTATKSASHNLQLTSPLRASAADLAFSCPIQACRLSQAPDWTCGASAAKGQTVLVWSRGGAEQTPIVRTGCDSGAFHRSHKGVGMIKIFLIAASLSLILRYCSKCEVSVQPTCKTKQLPS